MRIWRKIKRNLVADDPATTFFLQPEAYSDDEWAEHKPVHITNDDKIIRTIPNQYFGFCDWIKTLPYAELITGEKGESKE